MILDVDGLFLDVGGETQTVLELRRVFVLWFTVYGSWFRVYS